MPNMITVRHMVVHAQISRTKWAPHVKLFKITQGHQKWHRSVGYLRLLISDPW